MKPWLKGFEMVDPTTVRVWPSIHCVGCGRVMGTTCFALDEGEKLPEKPDWPFDEADCPVCHLRREIAKLQDRIVAAPEDKLTERMLRLRALVL